MRMVGEWAVVFNATFNTISAISWRSVLLAEDTGIPGETHRPAANAYCLLCYKPYCLVFSKLQLEEFEDTKGVIRIRISNCFECIC